MAFFDVISRRRTLCHARPSTPAARYADIRRPPIRPRSTNDESKQRVQTRIAVKREAMHARFLRLATRPLALSPLAELRVE
jgi:hypothetical protein